MAGEWRQALSLTALLAFTVLQLSLEGVCALTAVTKSPLQLEHRPAAEDVALVVSGMLTQSDLDIALAMPNLAHVYLYNTRADSPCSSAEVPEPGHWCGLPCAGLRYPAALATCKDVLNMGRGEAGFFRFAADHYYEAHSMIVMTQSTFRHYDREARVKELMTERRSAPRCYGWDPCREDPTQCRPLVRSTFAYSVPGIPCAYDEVRGVTNCNVTYFDDTWRSQTMGRAEPSGLGSWLQAHAPEPGPTDGMFCTRGVFRTNGLALRKRPKEQYEAMLEELLRSPDPEAAFYVERAALYLFASI